ncbi:hypothetical protein Plec18167_000417 [Paecilomyces lecythidis]|uniref:Uncharacterized protein n=1 Tax=Paecilomyces lecythidis TaxID=3004212 RepID=A0ABR3YDW0_9EURO
MSPSRVITAHRWPSRSLGHFYLNAESLSERTLPVNSRKLFHSTPIQNAARKAPRSPVVRRQQLGINGPTTASHQEKGDQDDRGQSRETLLAIYSTFGHRLYDSAKRAGRLPDISAETYIYISKRIVEESFSGPPSAIAVRRISKVAATFPAHSRPQNALTRWVISATALAGGYLAILHVAAEHLKRVPTAGRTPILDRIEQWATASEDPDPRVSILYAQILGRRGQYREAIAIMEKLMQRIYPTKLRPSMMEDITMNGNLEPPWQLYAWLTEKAGERATTDETLKIAALEYQDPSALVTYAHVMQTQGDLEMYEECMNKAATAGDSEACRKLANFYYLTHHGRFPRREDQNTSGMRNRIVSLFKQSRTKDDYRKLAMDWYELSFNHGSKKAALLLSMLLREDGFSDLGREFLSYAAAEDKLLPLTRKLTDNWDNKDYNVKIPIQLLDT